MKVYLLTRLDSYRRAQSAKIIFDISGRISRSGIAGFTPDTCRNHSVSSVFFLFRSDQIDLSRMADRRRFNCLFSNHDFRFRNTRSQRACFDRRNSFSVSVTTRNSLLVRRLSDHFILCDSSFGSGSLLHRCETLWTT